MGRCRPKSGRLSSPPHLWGGVARRATEGLTRKSKSLALDQLTVDPARHLAQFPVDLRDADAHESPSGGFAATSPQAGRTTSPLKDAVRGSAERYKAAVK